MDVKEETCDADMNIMEERTVNVKEEYCERESVQPKQESLGIKEEVRELGSVSIKEEDEEKCVSTEIHNYRSMESIKKDDHNYEHQDGAVTGLVSSRSRHSSSPESSINLKHESLQSDTQGTEGISYPKTQEGQPSPKTSSKTISSEAMLFRVIIAPDDIRRVSPESRPDTVDELVAILCKELGVLVLQFEDPAFQNELCNLTNISDLPEGRATLKIIQKTTPLSSVDCQLSDSSLDTASLDTS
ncbi:uncharacterized protein LOC120533329 [Polypterus senegalus]|uniref:uncharacterized protein LOC120533329 n=1 Tax=Polypterus senegalus TaxID=55291 RepID=UPI001966A1C3|nr:uncharacterized protein LOC120533329 [Polypterus senegalus]